MNNCENHQNKFLLMFYILNLFLAQLKQSQNFDRAAYQNFQQYENLASLASLNENAVFEINNSESKQQFNSISQKIQLQNMVSIKSSNSDEKARIFINKNANLQILNYFEVENIHFIVEISSSQNINLTIFQGLQSQECFMKFNYLIKQNVEFNFVNVENQIMPTLIAGSNQCQIQILNTKIADSKILNIQSSFQFFSLLQMQLPQSNRNYSQEFYNLKIFNLTISNITLEYSSFENIKQNFNPLFNLTKCFNCIISNILIEQCKFSSLNPLFKIPIFLINYPSIQIKNSTIQNNYFQQSYLFELMDIEPIDQAALQISNNISLNEILISRVIMQNIKVHGELQQNFLGLQSPLLLRVNENFQNSQKYFQMNLKLEFVNAQNISSSNHQAILIKGFDVKSLKIQISDVIFKENIGINFFHFFNTNIIVCEKIKVISNTQLSMPNHNYGSNIMMYIQSEVIILKEFDVNHNKIEGIRMNRFYQFDDTQGITNIAIGSLMLINSLYKNQIFYKNYSSVTKDLLIEQQTQLQIIQSSFTNNEAFNGFFIYISSSNINKYQKQMDIIEIDSCIFSNNSNYNREGGALTFNIFSELQSSRVLIVNCQFLNNKAQMGGAIYIEDNYLVDLLNVDQYMTMSSQDINNFQIINTIFHYNAAKKIIDKSRTDHKCLFENYGGAIALRSIKAQFKLLIEKIEFIGNQADQIGGVIYSENGNIIIQESKAQQNTAEKEGGTFFFKKSKGTIKNSEIIGSNAKVMAGFLKAVKSSEIVIENLKILNSYCLTGIGSIFVLMSFSTLKCCQLKIDGFMSNYSQILFIYDKSQAYFENIYISNQDNFENETIGRHRQYFSVSNHSLLQFKGDFNVQLSNLKGDFIQVIDESQLNLIDISQLQITDIKHSNTQLWLFFISNSSNITIQNCNINYIEINNINFLFAQQESKVFINKIQMITKDSQISQYNRNTLYNPAIQILGNVKIVIQNSYFQSFMGTLLKCSNELSAQDKSSILISSSIFDRSNIKFSISPLIQCFECQEIYIEHCEFKNFPHIIREKKNIGSIIFAIGINNFSNFNNSYLNQILLLNNDFHNNEANIFIQDYWFDIKNNQFMKNQGGIQGGALLIHTDKRILPYYVKEGKILNKSMLFKNTFSQNYAFLLGGGVYLSGRSDIITEQYFNTQDQDISLAEAAICGPPFYISFCQEDKCLQINQFQEKVIIQRNDRDVYNFNFAIFDIFENQLPLTPELHKRLRKNQKTFWNLYLIDNKYNLNNTEIKKQIINSYLISTYHGDYNPSIQQIQFKDVPMNYCFSHDYYEMVIIIESNFIFRDNYEGLIQQEQKQSYLNHYANVVDDDGNYAYIYQMRVKFV